MATEFGVLGDVEIRVDGVPVDAGPAQQRRVLAALLVDAGRPVPVDRLLGRAWPDGPPSRATLYSYLSRLRQLLAPIGVRLARRAGGYALLTDPESIDLHRFRGLVAEARAAPADERAHALFTRALALWRDDAFAGLDGAWLDGLRDALSQERLSAALDHHDVLLRLGEYAEMLSGAAAVALAHPMDERLARQLMLANYRAGRPAAALDQYRRIRRLLVAELGAEPSVDLERLHRLILAADPALAVDLARPPFPALLPPDLPDFTGRTDQVAALAEWLAPGDGHGRTALAVAGIAGMAGIGKSALAVHVAHQIARSYPDGQLHIDLRGAERTPPDPADALALFLRALGVDWRAIPTDPTERKSLYRSLMADRRILVVLDNAASAKQVRPLLPGAATCAVLITSRPRLTGLEGARWIELGTLSAAGATHLLGQIAGEDRITRQRADAAEVVRLCGGLPLAIRVAGARLTARPGWPLAHLAALLGDERHRLDQLATGDLAVRASLALSYEALEPPARRLFGLLGLFDVPDFTTWLAVAVLETSSHRADQCVESLVDAQLLTLVGSDRAGQLRYRLHDLVRLFARERAEADLTAEQRIRALRLGLGGWLALAERMAPHVPGPCYAPISGSAPRPPIALESAGVPPPDPVRWFDAERAALLSAVRQACDLGLEELAFDLAGCLEKYFDLRGMYADWAATNSRVMRACQHAGNLRGEAVMLRGLVDVRTWIADAPPDQAMTESGASAERLLDMFTRLGDARGIADAEVTHSWALTAQGRHLDALDAATRALHRAEGAAHPGGQARAHVALALAHREQSRLDRAVTHLTEALSAARRLGNARYEATVLQFLGIGHLEMGDLDSSERHLAESLAISHRFRDNYTEALTLLALARLQLRRGDPRARVHADAALAIAREYHMPHHLADALAVLGEIELAHGRPAQAASLLTESVAIWRTRGWLSYQAATLTTLGRAYASIDPPAARRVFNEARALYLRLGHTSKANDVTGLLTQPTPEPP
ncbi:AfsR/SARP family transcriptional regulator [Phytohabitans rumicis]|uniref:AfsR/SARP family transcriptional regulator n=1 Tax=Phytohabitans rumicis TaxID=1076125 RepID=UPI0031E7600E